MTAYGTIFEGDAPESADLELDHSGAGDLESGDKTTSARATYAPARFSPRPASRPIADPLIANDAGLQATLPLLFSAKSSRATPLKRGLCMFLPLMLADTAALCSSTLIAFFTLRFLGPLPISGIHTIMPALAAATFAGYLACEQYAIVGINPVVEFRQLTKVNTLVFITIAIGVYLVAASPYWEFFFALNWAASLILTPVLRSLVRAWCAQQRWWGQPALLLGCPEAAGLVAQTLEDRPSAGLRPLAFVSCAPSADAPSSDAGSEVHRRPGFPLTTINFATAAALIRNRGISYAIIATPDPAARSAAVATATALSLPSVLLMNPDQPVPSLWCDARDCAGLHTTQVRNRLLQPFPRFVKRTMDLTLTLAGGILILPLLALIALAIKLTSRGPIFFGHTRIGLGGRPFTAWKFRTMVPDANTALQTYLDQHPELFAEWMRDHKLKRDPRVTLLGRFLRKTSLDEFPQLWNVLRGDMSLVGPRPIVDEEIAKYNEDFDQYMRVRPGITGLWQVSGRSTTTYEQRVRFDQYYVQNWSPWLDLHVLARTVKTLTVDRSAY